MNQSQKVWLTIGIAAVIVLIVAYIIGFFGGSLTGQAIYEGEVMTLGFMGPLTGDAAAYGESIKKGVDLALSDSGLENIQIIYEDSGCNGKDAVNAAQKLINVNNVVAIIGEVCSGATIPAGAVAEQEKVVMISASSTSPEITTLGDFIFRTVPSDALQGSFGADLIYDKGYTKLAVLYGNEEYGVGFNNVLLDSFKGEIVASEAFERGATDLRTQLTKINAKNPDAIYFISNSPDSAVAGLQQIKELGITAEVFASEGFKAADILEAGSAAEGLIVTSVSSGTTEFTAKHRSFYGEEPGPFAAQAYDAATALFMVIKQGARTSEEIKDALYDIEFQGASGFIEFDQYGDVIGNYDVYEVINGEFVLQ